MIQIEITNVCNFKCYFCGSRKIQKHDTIALDTFKTIIDDCETLNISKIYLTPSDGEIFMDDTIIEKLKYIHTKNIKVEFVTNFTAISIEKIKMLKDMPNMTIIVSDYGDGDRELFKYMTRTSDKMFDKYLKNIKYAKSIGLNLISSSRNLNYSFSYDNTNDMTIEKEYRTVKERTIKKEGVCSMLYSPRIMSNGDFIQCRCSGERSDLDNSLNLGNIYETSLIDLYNHIDRYNIFRNQQQNIYNDYCQSCDSFKNNEAPNINILKRYISIKKSHDSNI